MKNLLRRVKPSDPLLTTRWFDVISGGTWLIAFFYSICTLVAPLPTFSYAGAPSWYSMVWSLGVGTSALVAAISAHWIFYDGGLDRITKKRLERDALLILGGFTVIYGILVVVDLFHGYGVLLSQTFRVIETLPLLVFRIHHLNGRIRGLMTASVPVHKETQP